MADPKQALDRVITALVALQQAGIRNLPKPPVPVEVKPGETSEKPQPGS